ncbi:MAG: nucleotidyl transferase AbiEii/AbiGii toxin family protein [Acidimicrobiales bacterium]
MPDAQRLLWPLLAPTVDLGLVLHGGTAVALRYGNRVSVDFDFFGSQPLDKGGLRAAMPEVAGAGRVIQDGPDTLTVLSGGVKVSFFGTGFDTVAEPDLTEDGVLLVASPVDLLAHKLKVILQRAESKDYLDIAALLSAGVTLSDGLSGTRRLFGVAFQPAEALKALTYFADVPELPSEIRLQLQAATATAKRHRRANLQTPTYNPSQDPPSLTI